MLILTRKIGGSLIIGEGVRVVILEVRGKQVRLGIEAPNDVVVLREEVFVPLIQANQVAVNFRPADFLVMISPPPAPGGVPVFPGGAPEDSHSVPVDTRDLGRLAAPQNRIIAFPAGLLGFSDCKRFVLVQPYFPAPYHYLQCIEHTHVVFAVIEARTLAPGFLKQLNNNTLQDLGAEKIDQVQILAVLHIPAGQPRSATANLMAPLLINFKERLGKQIILDNSQYSLNHPVFPA